MKLQRFFIDPGVINGKEIILSDKDTVNQIKKVLRFRVGDNAVFLDGFGKEYISVIKEISNLVIKGEIIENRQNQNEPELKITLYQALCKKDKFEWVLQKGTEIGISEFVPIITERTEKLGLNVERAEKILKESAEQSERGIIPKLLEIKKFVEIISNLPKDNQIILLDRSGKNIKHFSLSSFHFPLNIFVGPEGGFSESELKSAKEAGVKIVSLGSRVLRTETAGLVAAAILLNK